jgi:hypothetical protein
MTADPCTLDEAVIGEMRTLANQDNNGNQWPPADWRALTRPSRARSAGRRHLGKKSTFARSLPPEAAVRAYEAMD